MDIDNLVHMANRIGEFFEAMPDHDEACEGIAQHLRRYWEPRMRQALQAHVAEGAGVGLSPIVLEAVRDRLAGPVTGGSSARSPDTRGSPDHPIE